MSCMRKKTEINPGDVFKNWKVIKEVDKRSSTRRFLCECLICNNEYEVQYGNLMNKNNCFCCFSCSRSKIFEKKADELIGKVFGRLIVISKYLVNEHGQWLYNCLCECGSEKVIIGRNLTTGNSTSCGCYNIEKAIERFSGKNNPSWKDGISTQNELDRRKLKASINPIIRERDNYICQNCNNRGGDLEVHHIFDFSTYPELKFEETNLITLCKICHDKFHSTYSGKSTNTLEHLESWTGKEYKYHYELLETATKCLT